MNSEHETLDDSDNPVWMLQNPEPDKTLNISQKQSLTHTVYLNATLLQKLEDISVKLVRVARLLSFYILDTISNMCFIYR